MYLGSTYDGRRRSKEQNEVEWVKEQIEKVMKYTQLNIVLQQNTSQKSCPLFSEALDSKSFDTLYNTRIYLNVSCRGSKYDLSSSNGHKTEF